ncbi:serine/threonine-protein kinase [Polyangium aurulentum]|uniref:serine/threonine-protein kinase n=1 Tax=Polyangium aurulentum TaxID=2567896 RepID=UPI00146D9B42|nr:serine/threonine-protein kinase [Polyangium aurulentum]UQA60290.1 serine/threonine protein kinase [Polyangium aurulentum]
MILSTMGGSTACEAREGVRAARRLGRYRLEARIAAGAMGEVWLAEDVRLRRKVALKILRPEIAMAEGAGARFEQEARSASRLSCPHTIRIYDYGACEDGLSFIAMELLDGADLGTILSEHGALPEGRVARLAEQICLSLAEAEDSGIVHRDIKPANLFLTRAGDDEDFVKLLDFGIAKVQGQEVQVKARSLMGTPAYMAPELWIGREADARSDLYALGVTLYKLLTGSLPFTSRADRAIARAHLHDEPDPPSTRRSGPVHPALEAAILRCLEKDPDKRFQSARELRAVLVEAGISARWTQREARAFWVMWRASRDEARA